MLSSLYKGLLLLIVFLLIIGLASCSKKAPEKAVQPPPPPNSLLALKNALTDSTKRPIIPRQVGKENKQLITLAGMDPSGPQLVIDPALAGRVMGVSFDGDNGDNLFWVDKSILDGSYFSAKPPSWNAGGLRTWLSPEDLFFLPEDKDAKKWFVPAELDPAPYTVYAQGKGEVTLQLTTSIKSNMGKTYNLLLTRRIQLVPFYTDSVGTVLPKDLKYVGINLFHSMQNLSDGIIGKDMPYICLWSLLQMNPSGTMLIPLAKKADPKRAYRDYFNPLGPDRIAIENNIISVKIDGKYRSKIGVNAKAAGPGIAYLKDEGSGQGILFVQLFTVDPKGIYVDKPWGKKSDYGDAIEMYNDDGNMGGFTEMECHSPAKKMARGESEFHELHLHIFKGPIPELHKIGSLLLSTDISKAKYY
ncbi:MAG: hypothetical protein Q8O92_06940 [Candidatus Latescibacter sp.]|nr:hypothetical protein [Candidatus Latescibacter sp.]